MTENVEINRILNYNFFLLDVKGDGNCLYRTFADLIYHFEERCIDIKIVITNHIIGNKRNYESLISRSGISVKGKDAREMVQPNLDDFLRMIARERAWGNEGSLYDISDALKLIVIIFGVDMSSYKIININKLIPNNLKSLIPLTLVNEINHHFVPAHRKTNPPTFGGET